MNFTWQILKKFKQLGLLEPWFVITHTIWTTQEDTVSISDRDRNGGQCSVFRSDVSRNSLIVSESQKECSIVCVITNQGSSNPNCLNFLKDAYKVYQGVPPTYQILKSKKKNGKWSCWCGDLFWNILAFFLKVHVSLTSMTSELWCLSFLTGFGRSQGDTCIRSWRSRDSCVDTGK